MSDDHRIGSVLLKFDWSAATLILFFYNYYLSSFNLVLCKHNKKIFTPNRPRPIFPQICIPFMQFVARACYIIDKYLRIHLTRDIFGGV
jgi:hypothetical protein